MNHHISVFKPYRANGAWLMNDETALKLKTLKDQNGQYLWNQNSDTILGKPVHISEYMPSEGKPIAFGDFSYYTSLTVCRSLYAPSSRSSHLSRRSAMSVSSIWMDSCSVRRP